MKNLPLGIQDFRKIIENNLLYADKTKYIYDIVNSGSYYFLSRPRRFGKSLLISTMKELFLGNKELFKNLWIYDKVNWQKHPVIHISFSTLDYKEQTLNKAISNKIDKIAADYKISLKTELYSTKFEELIHELAKTQKVVILIDEYDKPIIDYIEDTEQAKENMAVLKNFYSVLKDADSYLRFLFITGVSKFSKVSIFSDLNNLEDITIDSNSACLTGITEQELKAYFEPYIQKLEEKYSKYNINVRKKIRTEYLGYSWDGVCFLYNPFTLLNLFKKSTFGDYWFQSGTPTFLMKLIKEQHYTTFDLENKTLFVSTFDKYEIEDITLISLLFQTGYLTIKKYDQIDMTITLDYPNNEVERAFSIHLLANLNGGKTVTTNSMLYQMTVAVEENKIEKFLELLSELFKGIAYPLIDNKEKYYHSVFYLVVKMLGFNIESEIMTIDGRIDCVLKTKDVIYIIEFKTGNTIKAINQIRDKAYHQKYESDKRKVQLLGIDFDTENKKIADYKLEDA